MCAIYSSFVESTRHSCGGVLSTNLPASIVAIGDEKPPPFPPKMEFVSSDECIATACKHTFRWDTLQRLSITTVQRPGKSTPRVWTGA